MNQLIVVPRTSAGLAFLKKLLEQLDSVKEVKTVGDAVGMKTSKKKSVPFAKLSESSLAKEWLSSEDDVWDEWYDKKKKRAAKLRHK